MERRYLDVFFCADVPDSLYVGTGEPAGKAAACGKLARDRYDLYCQTGFPAVFFKRNGHVRSFESCYAIHFFPP